MGKHASFNQIMVINCNKAGIFIITNKNVQQVIYIGKAWFADKACR